MLTRCLQPIVPNYITLLWSWENALALNSYQHLRPYGADAKPGDGKRSGGTRPGGAFRLVKEKSRCQGCSSVGALILIGRGGAGNVGISPVGAMMLVALAGKAHPTPCSVGAKYW